MIDNKNGWLVNGCLTCIPGTRTFWHDLLDWLPNLKDMTGGWTENHILPGNIENYARNYGEPDYIIRNATYIRRMSLKCKTFSLLQDVTFPDPMQLDVCNNSTVTVFNSRYTQHIYKNYVKSPTEIIPLGVDFNLFNKLNNKTQLQEELGILPNSILFVGANNSHPKGFDVMMQIINNSNFNFCLVMKDDFNLNTNRVRTFNKVPHETLVKIYNACDVLVCTSTSETQHLAGIEAGACGLPIVASNVGMYYDLDDGEWGRLIRDRSVSSYIEKINYILNHYDDFDSRNYLINMGFTLDSCKNSWRNLIEKY